MQDEREELIDQMMQATRAFYHQHLQCGGGRQWTEADLTMPQLKVLLTVALNQGVTMTHLSRAVGMTLSTATGVADRLVAEGHVQREHDPHDRRLVLLRPTRSGLALVDNLTAVGEASFKAISNHLSLEELRLVARAMHVMHGAMLQVAREEQVTGDV
ncbi:MAG: MarR family transcriptional regulator [Dehalococcoidia bacterium]|nr:MarR family transcriptional regulator [Dehalococcoidia bacterium]